jgi:hypothetical protein
VESAFQKAGVADSLGDLRRKLESNLAEMDNAQKQVTEQWRQSFQSFHAQQGGGDCCGSPLEGSGCPLDGED